MTARALLLKGWRTGDWRTGGWRTGDLSGLDRDGAREAARRELSDPAYDRAQPGWVERSARWVLDAVQRVVDGAEGSLNPRLAAVVLVVVLALVAGVVLYRIGPLSSERSRAGVLAGAPVLSADGHRDRAEAAAGRQEWAEAVRERFRAMVRELEDRGLLDRRPGRTAGEVAREAGRSMPPVSADLRRAAHLFDEIWYGGRAATRQSYDVMVEIDQSVTASRLMPA